MRWLSLTVVVLAALLGYRLNAIGVFKDMKDFIPADSLASNWECKRHENVESSEDFVVVNSQHVFISYFDTEGLLTSGRLMKRGAIYYYNIWKSEAPVEMTLVGYGGVLFSPHGISIAEHASNYLVVVDHGYDESHQTIVQFEIDMEALTLTMIRKASSPLFRSLNTLSVEEASNCMLRLFAVNDQWYSPFSNPLKQFLEQLFGTRWASLVYYDDAGDGQEVKVSEVITDLHTGAVGLEVDQKRGLVYVSQVLSNTVAVFDRHEWRRVSEIRVPSQPDNLHLDNEGRIWVGGHPNILRTFYHMLTGEPCAIHSFYLDAESRAPRHVYYSESPIVSGVSTSRVVTSAKKDMLLLGTIRDSFAVCERSK